MEPLETTRLLMRPLVAGDLDDLQGLYGDPRVMRYITGAPRSREETARRLEGYARQHLEHGFGLCAALSREDGAFIGRCGLEPRVTAAGVEGDLAWMFAPRWWGKGLGLESGRELVRFGLDELRLTRVYATADHWNAASIAIMQRLGMSLAAEFEHGVEYEIRR